MQVLIMFCLRSLLLIFLLSVAELFGLAIETFYGTMEVSEPVLIELIHCPAMQRLKHVYQYGVSYYTTTHKEEYTRFDHSLGVFAILRAKNASLEEQITGLLHDVSHTAFSHVADWAYNKENQEDDYQSSIYNLYLTHSGIEEILNRHGYEVEQVSTDREDFLMLEQSLPDLCADRIDYNIQGAYFAKFLTKEEAQKLFLDICFEDKKWILTNQELATRLAYFTLFMTENCWGSAKNFITSRWLADALLKAFEKKIIAEDEFHFGTDQLIWERLVSAKEPFIENQMRMLQSPDSHYRLVDPEKANFFIKFKSRGIDPWIKKNGKIVRLTSLNSALSQDLQKTKERSIVGWPVEILQSDKPSM